ncbi:M1 family aminopeptidase [Flavobacterium selenitireducens]|uniref:M1 family aminopeptidase n=1 Tax=Flavobacterium selenitireducens TaxID=2722704 RepID=UPI00168B472A|nr:M1 family aminopeptidase [Flavobacterium selenitireducens]MBD3581757.1 T9SS type A sorting domain-containing protein [Flavobacterium selenitireducens]
MTKIYLLSILVAVSAFGQSPTGSLARIAESEMKSAESLMSVQVNPNTQNYDITYHKLEFTIDPAEYFISGKVTTTFTALSNMSTIHFDLTEQLNVSSVKKGATNLAFAQNNEELIITLPSVQAAGTSATVEIIYSGEPAFGEQGFNTTSHNGVPAMFTLSEPFGARDWWPCKQDLNDKVDSIDVFITAPSQYVSVSNGLEVGQTTSGASKTTHFHHGYPIPAYLIAIAITNYQVFTLNAGSPPNEFPIVNYVYPEDFADAQDGYGATPAIMDLYEELFETYPFSDEKYGHAQFGWGGGMEHTTVSFMANFSRDLIAHELGHQWFGDKVTCGSWKDIWLNEGFATYLSGLTVEHLDGLPQFIDWKAENIDFITSSNGGAVYLTDAEALNVGRIFSSRLSYSKGAMVLEMLRWKLGDANFYQALRNYLADPNLAYDYAVTNDLQTHLEAVSGQDLDGFFQDWVYRQGYPIYTITAANWGNGIYRFTVNQTQSHFSVNFFEMPVPVRVFGSGGQQMDLVLQNTVNGQTFDMAVPFTVTSVQFDPERHIISRDSNASLGVANFATLAGANIYPNPAKDQLTVNLPLDATLQKVIVTNPLGQQVLETGSAEVNVSNLKSGVHFLTVYSDKGNRTFKFVKE